MIPHFRLLERDDIYTGTRVKFKPTPSQSGAKGLGRVVQVLSRPIKRRHPGAGRRRQDHTEASTHRPPAGGPGVRRREHQKGLASATLDVISRAYSRYWGSLPGALTRAGHRRFGGAPSARAHPVLASLSQSPCPVLTPAPTLTCRLRSRSRPPVTIQGSARPSALPNRRATLRCARIVA
jgi:hypothetical protein